MATPTTSTQNGASAAQFGQNNLLSGYHPSNHPDWTPTAIKIFEDKSSEPELMDLVTKIHTHHKVSALFPKVQGHAGRWLKPTDNPENETSDISITSVQVPLQLLYAPVSVPRTWLEEDAGDNFKDWLGQQIISDCRDQINEAIINGDGVCQPFGIINTKDVRREEIGGEEILDGLLRMLGKIGKTYQPVWLVSQEAFGKLMTLGGADGRIFTPHLISERDGYRLFGHRVYVTSSLPSDTNVILGDLNSGYALFYNCPQDQHLRTIEYVEAVKFVYRMRVGGLVTDPKAFVLAKI